jgi:hypothetical protein
MVELYGCIALATALATALTTGLPITNTSATIIATALALTEVCSSKRADWGLV